MDPSLPNFFGSFAKHAKSLFICSLLATAAFQYGFDTGIVNGFQATPGFLKVFGIPTTVPGVFTIGTVFQQLVTSLLQVGLICGSLLIGPFSRFYGRLPAFFVASCLTVVAITIQIFVTSKAAIYVARWLMGTANGFYVNLVVLYTSECVPAHLRGAGVSVYQPFVNIGTLLAAIVSNAFSTNLLKLSYRAQLAILYIVPVWLAIFVFFIPESPRWLALRGKYADAEKSLKRLRGNSATSEEIQEEIAIIKENVTAEREANQHIKWRELFEGPNLRRTLLCAASATFHAASGINFLVGYATFFFQISGTKKPFVNTIILQTCGFVASIAALPAARIFSRRSMLLAGFCVTTVTMFIVALLYTLAPHDPKVAKAMVAMVCLFNAAYGGTIGPIAWVVAGEIPSNRLRSDTYGLSAALGFTFAWLTVFTTPYFLNPSQLNWGPKIAWVWFPSNLITLTFIYIFLPETKGRSLEEMDEIFSGEISPAKNGEGASFRSIRIAFKSDLTTTLESDSKDIII